MRNRQKRQRVLNSAGLEVTQHEWNALMRSVANLSALVVYLEDQLDDLRAQLPTDPAGSKGPESGETPQGVPG